MSRRIEPEPSYSRVILASVFMVTAVLCASGCYENHEVAVETLRSDAGAPNDDDMMSDDDMMPDDDEPMGNECGSCEPVQANALLSTIGIEAESCCTEDDLCGLDLGVGTGCMQRDQEGTLSDECPDQSLGGFIMLDGCCRPDETCGIMDNMLGFGCTNALSMLGVTGGDGEPETCDYTEPE